MAQRDVSIKEVMMNMISISKQVSMAVLLVSVAVVAHARGGGVSRPDRSIPHSVALSSENPAESDAATAKASVNMAQAASASPVSGKTRAQVQAEILQAGEAGMLASRGFDYPPNADTISRNRARYLRLEQAWKDDGVLPGASQ
ncbi:DUF4148 domain-containing protein [Paraburkholderia sp. BL6669N2]|uniref:DUF4148 domain-containing protein n=1 Tax=Paraburkholderia sp. BL6669N2 TaxID=1938807 RepID=UPI0011C05DFD|nr:DUF4148 domain-containing protein [Paraburkholderia sp. BL6669N2]